MEADKPQIVTVEDNWKTRDMLIAFLRLPMNGEIIFEAPNKDIKALLSRLRSYMTRARNAVRARGNVPAPVKMFVTGQIIKNDTAYLKLQKGTSSQGRETQALLEMLKTLDSKVSAGVK